jgi:hypothetical protein
MNPRFECGVTASFLSSGASLVIASHCAALIGAAGVLLAHTIAARAVFVAPILCWPAACYFGLRVSVDASLFKELAMVPDEGGPALDELLRRHGFAAAPRERTIAERSAGALTLWKRLIGVTAIQIVASLAAIMIEVWAR